MDNVHKDARLPAMGRRNEHTQEQQREMALTAAELLIVKEGVDRFSMRKVAQAIGYTVGNLYLLFANQDDLLAAINERTADAMHTHLRDGSDGLADPRARLRAMAEAYIDFARRHPHRFRMLFEHRLPDDMQPRHSTDLRIARLFELVEANVQALLPGARPDALHAAATALWSAVHGVCLLVLTGKVKWSGQSDARKLAGSVVDIVLNGLLASAPARRKRARG